LILSKLSLGVLASGRGSNLASIISAIDAGKIPGEIKLVLSDKPQAQALVRAWEAGLPARAIVPSSVATTGEFEDALAEALREAGVELVVLAGFMRILSPRFVGQFSGRIMNIHPSLLPSFPGLDAQRQAVEYGVRVSGCTVHFVDQGMDTGPIILQKEVPVLPDDTPETLEQRILVQEHRLYPEAIALYAAGRLSIEGRRVIISEEGAK
jgi:phosphoribosylglycinamide formyltransferase-1